MYLLGKLKNDKRYRNELTPEYQSLLEDFTIHLTQQQLSNLTIERAIYMIGKFLAFILSLRIIEVGTVTTDVINIFLSTMFRRGNQFHSTYRSATSPITISMLKSFLSFYMTRK